MAGHDRSTRMRFVVSTLLVAACPLLMLCFSHGRETLFPTYRWISKAVMGALASVCSIVPFALWDVGYLTLGVLGICVGLHQVRVHRSLLPLLSIVTLACSSTLFMFVGGWALNHYAPPLATEIGLTVDRYSTEQLAEATAHYLREAARLAPEVPRNKENAIAEQDFYELARIAGQSYGRLEGLSSLFQGSTVPVKALLLFGEPLLYTGHTGIFWAPTGEASVPAHCPPADLPFVMCHETAHRLGLASEQEANFAGFLACQASDDVRLAYSGNYNAFCYCLNALYGTNPDAVQPLLQSVADEGFYEGVVLVLSDREQTRALYQAYEGPVEDVGTAVNDTYLKSFGESDGVRSYGLVVDYLIAWYNHSRVTP